MNRPPVALFGFNRADCTRQVFEAIRRHRPERLFLVADGPRPDVPTDAARCAEVRDIMRAVDWPCEVQTDFAAQNLGCKRRMASGLDWIFSQTEEAILLEDDCVPAPDLFTFCGEMLERYRDDPRVMHIGSANFQHGRERGEGSYYFSRYLHVWGWATWRRAWQLYDVDLATWPQARAEDWLATLFRTREEQAPWRKWLDEIHAGRLDTWDVQWVYACWRHGGLGVTPNVNLVTNIGAGPDATHTRGPAGSLAVPSGSLSKITAPARVEIDRAADAFTFDHHYGNLAKRRERGPLGKLRRLTAKLKRALHSS